MEYFEEELEINDFPQQLRYRICSRESIAQIQEFADVGISVKGLYYPPGREPKEGMERKLYLFLEARDQMSLKRAREEILRIMKEALRQLVSRFISSNQKLIIHLFRLVRVHVNMLDDIRYSKRIIDFIALVLLLLNCGYNKPCFINYLVVLTFSNQILGRSKSFEQSDFYWHCVFSEQKRGQSELVYSTTMIK